MAVPVAIRRKITRLRSGQPPRFIDLFSGCGGISLGFTTAGFEPIAAVELDPKAAESHGANFAKMSQGKHPEAHFKARNITEERPAEIFKDIGLSGAVDEQVDVLVGGPPCQAFTRVGRAKLRHEARRREEVTAESAFLVDGRVNLWEHYLAYVRDTKPLALLMENVPDILNHGGTNVAEKVAEELRREGYIVRYTLLNAAWYGVPQTRERMFLIGVHREMEAEFCFPEPSHFTVLPSGYEGTRATARKLIPQQGLELDFEHGHHWVSDPRPDAGLPTTTTAAEALADLPPIYAIDLLASGKIRKGAKSPADPTPYSSAKPTTDWSRLMRKWPEFETGDETSGHIIRFLPRDYKIFRVMEEGWQYPEIWRFVEDKRQRLLEALWRQRSSAARKAREDEIMKEWTLPYDPKKFPNKWWKLVHDKPVRTLMAHLGKDSYLLIPSLGTSAVACWSGPDFERHDFVLEHLHIEVKTTRKSRAEHEVSRLDQLHVPGGKGLLFVSIQLEETIGGSEPLATQVDVITDLLRSDAAALDAFMTKMINVGWSDEMQSSGELMRFNLRATGIYAVDASFPRLPETFSPPPGVVAIKYTIDLANLPALGMDEAMERLQR